MNLAFMLWPSTYRTYRTPPSIFPDKRKPKMLSRTRPLLARYDVSPHMVKWWKSQLKDNGQVRSRLGDQPSEIRSGKEQDEWTSR